MSMFLCSVITLSPPFVLIFFIFLFSMIQALFTYTRESELNLLYCFSWTIFFSNLLLYFINIHILHPQWGKKYKNREMAKRKKKLSFMLSIFFFLLYFHSIMPKLDRSNKKVFLICNLLKWLDELNRNQKWKWCFALTRKKKMLLNLLY